jgi:hypothetical protein
MASLPPDARQARSELDLYAVGGRICMDHWFSSYDMASWKYKIYELAKSEGAPEEQLAALKPSAEDMAVLQRRSGTVFCSGFFHPGE